MSADLALKILDSKLDWINFSIDGLDKNAYERIRIGLSFEEVLGNVIAFIMLRNKLNANTGVRISIIKNSYYLKDMDKIIAFWEKILDKDRGDSIKIDELNLGITDKNKDLSQIEYERNALIEKRNKLPCYVLFNTLVIKADGQVALCCVDQCRNLSLGNLNHQSIKEIWQGSRELKRIREIHIEKGREGIGFCKGCTAWI
ncbi:SPASM domain-containing protein [Campylobacter troglodytis]|uniref:SPASM domain-containing protein n=1 Tax=Campylobacter troglodytis TaxID=654363 RepID=UPI00115919BE|nr:SPASM domain-containing protein [Campylobacter troglodytis]TQR61236.1 hypothetical protein DMC01_02105 [Campylobacter troglodytis]